MSKRDILDPRLAASFAWRHATSTPADPPPDASSPSPEPKPPEAATGSSREFAKEAIRWAEGIAADVRHVWALADGPARDEAAKALLSKALRDLEIVALGNNHPREAVRLARLLVRHYPELPPGRRDLAFNLSWMRLVHPEVADLLCEAAALGDGWVAYLIEQCAVEGGMDRRYPGLGARLADIAESGPSWEARAAAVNWLGSGRWPESVPALRRALRWPHLRGRWLALEGLLALGPTGGDEGAAAPALAAEDLMFLLEDAVAHPPYDGLAESGYRYADALHRAVKRLGPPDAAAPLLRILRHDCVHIQGRRRSLDAAWALRALAARYPDQALAELDARLASATRYVRSEAVEAAAELPIDLARPRLRAAAADPRAEIADLAKDLCSSRLGEACTVDDAAVAAAVIGLVEPGAAPLAPSERCVSRLGVLRGASDEARLAMMEFLLGEAPDPEALALLLYALRDDGTRLGARPGLPKDKQAWGAAILDRFGARALPPILTEAARSPWGPHSWLHVLVRWTRERVLPEAEWPRVREIALQALQRCPERSDDPNAPRLLAQTGIGEEHVDALWSVAVDGRRIFTAHHAAAALVGLRPGASLDQRILRELADALARGDHERARRVGALGLRRGLARACDLVLRSIDELADPAGVPARTFLGHYLRGDGQISEAWLAEALGRPEALRFAVACGLMVATPPLSPDLLAALVSALGSDARAGAAAAEAAEALVRIQVLGPDDPRVASALDRAPLAAQAPLLGAILDGRFPLAPIRSRIAAILTSADAQACMELMEPLASRRPEGCLELYEEILERVAVPAVKARLERELDRGGQSAARYWVDPDDGDEVDDEEEDDLADDD